MSSENFGVVTVVRLYAFDEIYIRDVPISSLISAYRIAMAPGGGASLLQGGVAAANGSGLLTPVVFKRLIQGANVTLTQTADGIEIAASIGGGGVASLTNEGLGIPVVFNSSGILKTLQAGANMAITEPTPGVLLFTSSAGTGVLSLTNAGATGFSLIAGPTPSTAGALKTLSIAANHRLQLTEAANVISIGLNLLSAGAGVPMVYNTNGQINSLVGGPNITVTPDGVGNVTIGQAFPPSGAATGTFITATDQGVALPQSRRILGTTNQIVLTDNGAASTMVVGFPLTAPPRTAFDPTNGDHLVRDSYLQTQLVNNLRLRAIASATFDTVNVGAGEDGDPVPVLSTYVAGPSMTISPLAGAELTFLVAGTYVCTLSARVGVDAAGGVESQGAINATTGIGSTVPTAEALSVRLNTRADDTDIAASSTQVFVVTTPGSSITFRFEHNGGVSTLFRYPSIVAYHYV